MVENRKRNPMDWITEEEKNTIIGKAIDSWLEKKWATFGKWTARGIGAAAFSACIYFIATHGGFGK